MCLICLKDRLSYNWFVFILVRLVSCFIVKSFVRGSICDCDW